MREKDREKKGCSCNRISFLNHLPSSSCSVCYVSVCAVTCRVAYRDQRKGVSFLDYFGMYPSSMSTEHCSLSRHLCNLQGRLL